MLTTKSSLRDETTSTRDLFGARSHTFILSSSASFFFVGHTKQQLTVNDVLLEGLRCSSDLN